MQRRGFLGVVGGGVLTGTAGCVEELLGDGDSQHTRSDPGDSEQGTISGLDTTQPHVKITTERFDAAALAYDVVHQVALDGASHVTTTASLIGNDDSTTDRLTASGRQVMEGLRAGTELQFDSPDGHVIAPISHVVGTSAGLTLDPQDRLAGLDVSSVPDPTGATYGRRFTWDDRRWGRYEATLRIPRALYEYCRDRPRIDRYGFYAADAFNDVYVERLADMFTGQDGLSASEQVELAITFVQSLEYTSDSVTAGYDEYQRYPVETLVDRGGDCEDTAILLGVILREMGYSVRGVLLPGHMALAIKGDASLSGTYYTQGGDRFYYVETTDEGWRVGEMPDTYRGARARLVPLSGYPCLNFQLTSLDSEYGGGPFV